MIWLNWRQHRVAVLGCAVLFLGLAGMYSVAAGPEVVYAPASGFPRQLKFFEDLNNLFSPLPALIGAFVGAPLVARELEQRTVRYAWTQGVDRDRWLAAKVTYLGVVISVLATVFAAVHMRWFAPLAGEDGWFTTFTQGVPVFPANCLCGFAIGVAFGAVLRRTVPAMVATLVGSVVWSLVVWIGLRPHYLSPVISRPTEAVRDSFIVGHPGIDLVSYHPAERFWLFQGIEAGLLVATALALFAFTGWWLRRISV